MLGLAVLLIKPRSAAFSAFPPLSLMYLAAFLRENGHDSRILDLGYQEDAADLEALSDSDRPALFGITATTPEFPEAIRIVRALKARFPDVPVAVGGVHVSALGADAVSEAGADFGIVGEGEETLAALAAALDNDGRGVDLSGILGLIFKDDTGVRENQPRKQLPDIDALPPPAWDLVRAERYFSRPWGIVQKRKRTGFVVTSRRSRARAPGPVVDEVEALYRTHGVREILIAEDNFTQDPQRAAAICEEIMRRGLDIAWRIPNGVPAGTLDPRLVDLMSRSGCYLLGFRIESPDGTDADAIATARRHGIMTFGTFILGFPGETRQTMLETIRYAVRSGVDIAHFGFYAPYPGSDDFDKMKDLPGMRDWDRYLLFEPLPCLPLPPGQMKAILRRAYLSFYVRPERLRLYAQLLKPAQMLEAARALYAYLA